MAQNKIVICVGSGPSLTTEQTDKIAAYSDEGAVVIAVNRAYQYLAHCDIVYVADRSALKVWHYDIRENQPQAAIVTPHQVDMPGCVGVIGKSGKGLNRLFGCVNYGGSGGYQAVNLAYHLNPHRILLVGYDYQHTDGQTHVHGDHPEGWSNFGSPEERGRQFEPLAADLKAQGVQVVNCSGQTSLTMFERGAL